ncbi:MAG: YihY/virulence factor BrkB family protein [Rhizobiales bacterium]|nr:YihY/virulence factor BrkB family protein [Hyphomicrobiales bacterium]
MPGQEPTRDTRRFGLADLVAFGAVTAIVARFMVPRAATRAVPPGTPRKAAEAAPEENATRAAEPGRGRDAQYPWQIPWAGWKDILWRSYEQITEDRLLAVAAGVVFYGLLAIFPAISAFVSIYGLFADPATVDQTVDILASVIPADAMGPVQEQVERVATSSGGSLSFTFLVSLAIALWSANAGMKAIIDALNVAYGERERRSFIRLTLISFALTFGVILAGLSAIAVIVVFPVATSFLGVESLSATLIQWLRWPLLLLAVLLGLAVLYRFGPNRTEPRWQWVSVGSGAAAVLWLVGSAAFSFYLSRFADYSATYGSLAAGVGLMMWLWLSAIVVLLGAELNAEIEHQTAHDSTVGAQKPLGTRGATMADTVGEAQD